MVENRCEYFFAQGASPKVGLNCEVCLRGIGECHKQNSVCIRLNLFRLKVIEMSKSSKLLQDRIRVCHKQSSKAWIYICKQMHLYFD